MRRETSRPASATRSRAKEEEGDVFRLPEPLQEAERRQERSRSPDSSSIPDPLGTPDTLNILEYPTDAEYGRQRVPVVTTMFPLDPGITRSRPAVRERSLARW
jgi:hypothetical protein